jgi:OmpA-OmpF porin, OOP family
MRTRSSLAYVPPLLPARAGSQVSPARLAVLAVAVAALLGLMVDPAQAQTPDGPYPYIGLGLGQSRTNLDAPRLGNAALSGSGLTVTSVNSDERDTAFRFFGGLQFNRYAGVEGSYFRVGRFSYQATTSPAGQLDGRLKVQGLALDLVGTLPFTENFAGLAKVGYQRARTDADWAGSGAVAVNRSARVNDSGPRYGLGLQYAFTSQFFGRAEVERSRFADAVGGSVHATTYVISLVMPLGTQPAQIRRSAYVAPELPRAVSSPAPAPVTAPQAVAPAPAPAFKPAAATVRNVSYAAETLFGFDSAVLRDEGKTALNAFAGEVSGSRYQSIAVTGYADRIGSVTYNQTLSLQRADAVKAYLVASAGLDAARINALGRSESEPVTLPDECKGPMSVRVITCLQPDRRVEIQVAGTR